MASEALSPPAAEPLSVRGILNLPRELLLKIFGHFNNSIVLADGSFIVHEESKKTIASIRLTCSLFGDVAGEFLLRGGVEVSLDQASLDIIDEISRHPSLSRGVRGVRVKLDYRPRDMAESLHLFARCRQRDLHRMVWETPV
ncbi:hypothetical protein IMZ48_42020 [Candidatus Bathyarchaeota archaeon]|nr:hypothetical protein [Candidatus Bathyarchaeota archaeon]